VVLERLKCSLQGLAADSFTQITTIFPSLVVIADELALDFDNWFGVVIHNPAFIFTELQRSALNAIDSKLDAMSALRNPDLWTEEALAKDENWLVLRELAREALSQFGWKADPPPPSPDAYVGQ